MRRWIFLLYIVGISVTTHAAAACPDLVLSAQDGRLSATTKQIPLEKVLELAARKLSLTVHLESALAKNPVSVTFFDLPLAKAFDRLLEGANYVLTREHLYVWSREATSNSRPLDETPFMVVAGSDGSPNTRASLEDLKWQAVYASDSEARLTALNSLMERNEGSEALPTLMAALHDADPAVRSYVLGSLSEVEKPTAIDHFIEMARWDEDPDLRMMALKLLAERDPERAERLYEQMLGDGDEF